MRKKRSEGARLDRNLLEKSPHHAAELDARLDRLITSAAVCKIFGFTRANLSDALKKNQVFPRLKMQGVGHVFRVWTLEVCFGGGLHDDSFDSRMAQIDGMTDHDHPISIEAALFFFVHPSPIMEDMGNDE